MTKKYKKQKSHILSVKETARRDSRYTLPVKQTEDLKHFYIFNNYEEIKYFISCNTQLLSVLFEAPDHIHRIFGDVPLHLELYHDPEENYEGLFIIIETELSPKESLNLLEKFDEEWFFNNVSDDLSLIFTVMVRPV